MTELAPLLVRASAGTGKTYQLTGRMLAILVDGGDVSTILATTFTRKAAGEILQRILTALARAARDRAELAKLQQQVGRPGLTAGQCRDLLHRLIGDVHRIRICTLDSLFSQLARSFAFELRLPPGWRLSDEMEEIWLRRRAINATLAAIDARELATLVAMLGKGDAVRSVDYELQSIVLDGYNESRWSTPNAWKSLRKTAPPRDEELRTAILRLEEAEIGNKLADRLLRGIADLLRTSRWEELTSKKPVQDVAIRRGPEEPLTCYKKSVPPPLIEALETAHRAAKSAILGLLSEQTQATGEILGHYGHQIEALRQQLRVLGFDDVAHRLARWIESLDFEILQQRLDASINHVLLDEFQDTAPVQWAVIKPLAARAASGSEGHSFFCVGDTKQAIYGWRGGEAAIFGAVSEQLPAIQHCELRESHRSAPVISQCVNELFRGLTRHPRLGSSDAPPASKEDYESRAVVQFARSFPEHQSARSELAGHVVLETAPRVDTTGAGAAAERRTARLRYAAQRIAELAARAPERSIGVLTRTNRTVAELIFLLKQLDVDVSQEGGNPLTDAALVEVVLSALMLAEHPADLRWAYHVSHSPLSELLELPPWSGEIDPQTLAARVSTAADRVRGKVERAGLSGTLLWLGGALIPIAGAADALRLRQLVGLAHDYQLNPQPRLSAFVELVRQRRVERPQPAQVRVMTTHQAKGLEFDAVVLPDLDGTLVRSARKLVRRSHSPVDPPEALLRYIGAHQWSVLPQAWQTAFGEAAEAAMTEALCLLYVAVTRPRHALRMIIEPATKKKFDLRTPAALITHALAADADPTAPQTTLFEAGNQDWHQN